MGLFQKAVETYDAMEHLSGVFEEGRTEPLAPISHICTKAAIEITINKDGEFIQARRIDQKIIIPVTEKSAGRSGKTIRPHPLCDKLEFLSGYEEEKRNTYLEQLSEWIGFADKSIGCILKAVFAYVSNGSIVNDLERADLIKRDDKGGIKEKDNVICWRIVGVSDGDTAVWTNRKLFESFTAYYLKKISSEKSAISMVSGENTVLAAQHLKGVFSLAANAKIISSNDDTNFTFRGRFHDSEEALTIGYIDSQKGHNALKWIIGNQGVPIGNRVFICWNPQGRDLPPLLLPIFINTGQKREPTDYRSDLYKTIMGYKNNLQPDSEVIVAALEAATSGRLAVTYYNELQGSDFLNRIQFWETTCCWYDSRWGTSAPSLKDIIRYAFGVQQGNEETSKIEADGKMMSQHVQRLLLCKLGGSCFPLDIVKALVLRTYRLISYNTQNRNKLLFITCAVIRKYRIDRFKEEWDMALEPEKQDRSYQFGRLLAVLEKAEKDAYDKNDAKNEKRETNAIRMQSVFVQRPGYATRIIIDKVKNAYYPRLDIGLRTYYEKLIGEIMEKLSESGGNDFNKPLEDTYVLGYYLQKNALYSKKTIEGEKEDE